MVKGPLDRPRTVRRVVAGVNADGRSYVSHVGLPANVFLNPGRGGAVPPQIINEPMGTPDALLADIWSSSQADIEPASDETAEFARDIPPGVTRLRYVRHGPNRVAAMHPTESLNYDLVVDGRLSLILDDGEIQLGPMDFVILPRGLSHGWRAGPHGACLVVVMIGLASTFET